jgi:hypothetical protein
VLDDIQLYKANKQEIQGLALAGQEIEEAKVSPKTKACAQNLIALKLDHAKHAEKTKRILSCIRNALTTLTGIASTGVLGGPVGLIVSLSLTLGFRLVEAVINHKPQLKAFFTSLPSLWGSAQNHPRVRLNEAKKAMKQGHLEQQSLNNQIKEAIIHGDFTQVSRLQDRLALVSKNIETASSDKDQAQMELNQAKLSYFLTAESKTQLESFARTLNEVSQDPKALSEFKEMALESLGVELSGSPKKMYNQLADFIMSPASRDSTLAKKGAG